jgi:hypothetical protein
MSAGLDLGAIFDEHIASEFEAKEPVSGAEQAERLLALAGR